jgi:hypothetical protein
LELDGVGVAAGAAVGVLGLLTAAAGVAALSPDFVPPGFDSPLGAGSELAESEPGELEPLEDA